MTRYLVIATVRSVEERIRQEHVSGVGTNSLFTKVSEGWFVHFSEWPASVYLGFEKPPFAPGDAVRIAIEPAPARETP